MAESVGMELVRVTTGQRGHRYTMYKLRIGKKEYLEALVVDVKKLMLLGAGAGGGKKVMSLDDARQTVEERVQIANWEPTEEELEEIRAFVGGDKALLEEADKAGMYVLLSVARRIAELQLIAQKGEKNERRLRRVGIR
jgi:hypothetical protein